LTEIFRAAREDELGAIAQLVSHSFVAQSASQHIESLRDEPCVTLDGRRMPLWVNTGLMVDVTRSLEQGAEGVGLYRTEVPFLLRDRFPSEEEQRQIYREQLEAFAPKPVTMRTLDIGGDKALPYFPIEEDNPFLGWRGIRVTLDHPEIFLAQIRAMLKANGLPHQEAFLVGAGMGHRILGETAGLPLTKDIDTWLSPSG